MIQVLVCLFLGWNSILDWKKREISLVSLLVFGTMGMVFRICQEEQNWGEVLGGIGVGLGLLGLTVITKEGIGLGDGLLMCVTGVWLGWTENLKLLTVGLLLCAAFAGAGLALHKIKKEERLPFVPFLFLAYVGGIFL